MRCALICRATAAQSPPASCSFRALLEEEENRLVRVGQTVEQKGRASAAFPFPAPPVARKVTFKCSEHSEPERPSGWVSWVSTLRWSHFLHTTDRTAHVHWVALLNCPHEAVLAAPSHRHTRHYIIRLTCSHSNRNYIFMMLSNEHLSLVSRTADKMPQNVFLWYSLSWPLRFSVKLNKDSFMTAI